MLFDLLSISNEIEIRYKVNRKTKNFAGFATIFFSKGKTFLQSIEESSKKVSVWNMQGFVCFFFSSTMTF